jgi:DNA mismatch endonuclease (patch repair protein)
MSVHPRRDTGPELSVRKRLHAAGERYRVCWKIPGCPRRTIDIAFTRLKVAIFIDGCFWHGCPEHGETPASNTTWWVEKIQKNRARDEDTTRRLEDQGWRVLRFWEHENPASVVARIRATLILEREALVARRASPGHAFGSSRHVDDQDISISPSH